MKIKPIKTEEDYSKVMEEIKKLFHAEINTPEGDKLDILVTLAEAYERDHYQIPTPDPVEAINYFIESRGLSKKKLVELLGTESRVSEVLNHKRNLNLRMIRNLHFELGIPAEVLINEYPLENCYGHT